jgi:hypothetical protein
MIESLETRRLLAVAVSASNGVLVINGDKNNNVINVIENSGAVHVETSTLPNGTITQQDFTGITAIKINGGAGADAIFYSGNSIGADIHGDNAGNGSDAKNNKCGSKNGWNGGSSGGSGHDNGNGHGNGNGNGNGNGGAKAGNDQITVDDEGTGSTTVDGDRGADVLTIIKGNNTQVFGGDGNDQIFLDTSAEPDSTIVASGENGNDTFTTYGGHNTIHGGAGNDIVFDLGGVNTIDSATVQ